MTNLEKDGGEYKIKFAPTKDFFKLTFGLTAASYFLIGCYLYGTSAVENKSFNPIPIIKHYREMSENSIQEIKMRGRIAGSLENRILIHDSCKTD